MFASMQNRLLIIGLVLVWLKYRSLPMMALEMPVIIVRMSLMWIRLIQIMIHTVICVMLFQMTQVNGLIRTAMASVIILI